ncbi:MAG: TIGR03118 family protein [Acidobacteria bacterium]|nr:TIGR03118 family protein [Acidobacteriota bacterium]
MTRIVKAALFPAMLLAGLTAATPSWASHSGHSHGSGYVQTNLVSNGTISAMTTDANLVNSWGLAFFPGTPFWIADNGKGVTTLYDGQGTPEPAGMPLVVTIPPPKGSTAMSAPTGAIPNMAVGQFILPTSNQPALFLFDTENGTISGWNLADGTMAELVVDNSSSGAVYKGLAMGVNPSGVFLYATNFHAGTVDVFDSKFQPASLNGSFTDANIPSGFAPFGIANINGNLFVTYAMQDSDKHDPVAGPGNGFVDVFDTNGNLIQRFASHGKLNSPWGIAEAPFNFGRFSTDILVGNFGDGTINAFETDDAHFRGQLNGTSGKTIMIDGLWALAFGGALNSDPGTLYFTSGPNKEADGLFGSLAPQPQ